MKWRVLAGLALLFVASLILSCSSTSSTTTSSGTGLLFVTTQGNLTLTSYGIALSSGSISGITAISTGTNPSAIAVNPGLNTLFVSNAGGNFVTSYTLNSDGSLVVGANTDTGTNPMGLTVDPSGSFLFVANEGSSNISAFSISGTTLTPVDGSPFTTIPAGTTVPTGPVSVAIPPTGNYLYVANEFTNTISVFAYDASGALSPIGGSPYAACAAPSVCIAPAAVAISQNGTFLFSANEGSNNVTSFALCVVASATCPTPNGTMTQVGTPVAAGQQPIAIAVEPNFNFVYVADYASNQVSQYGFAPGSGVLTLLSNPSISTGTSPVSIAIRSGQTGAYVGDPTYNTTDYAFVANLGGTSLSIYTLDTATGQLSILGAPYVTSGGQPSALVAR
jgi:6-phosphogluconolactonase (cycloisomerase 2 family)